MNIIPKEYADLLRKFQTGPEVTYKEGGKDHRYGLNQYPKSFVNFLEECFGNAFTVADHISKDQIAPSEAPEVRLLVTEGTDYFVFGQEENPAEDITQRQWFGIHQLSLCEDGVVYVFPDGSVIWDEWDRNEALWWCKENCIDDYVLVSKLVDRVWVTALLLYSSIDAQAFNEAFDLVEDEDEQAC